MSSKKYTISNIKQLIDLNGSLVNFELDFKVVSLTNEPFDAVVMTQEMLDVSPGIEYQKAEGHISGQIKNDNGIYNNYFLILKSDTPMEVELTSDIREIPQAENPSEPIFSSQPIIPNPVMKKKKKENFGTELSSTTKYIIFIIVFLLFLGGFCVWYFYFRQTPSTPLIPEIKEMKDGLSFLENKLEEVKSGVSDNLSKLGNNISENIQELKGKIPDNIVSSTDLFELKNSLSEISKHQSPPPLLTPPPLSPSISAVDNAEEVLARLNSFKILNKQA